MLTTTNSRKASKNHGKHLYFFLKNDQLQQMQHPKEQRDIEKYKGRARGKKHCRSIQKPQLK